MTLRLAAQTLLAKITAWWRDGDDERLDRLVALDFQEFSAPAADSGVTAHQLVNRARNSRYEP